MAVTCLNPYLQSTCQSPLASELLFIIKSLREGGPRRGLLTKAAVGSVGLGSGISAEALGGICPL